MAKYQEKKNDLAMHRFKELFKDFSEEEQIKLAKQLGEITEVCKL